jgi:hypothetical protein
MKIQKTRCSIEIENGSLLFEISQIYFCCCYSNFNFNQKGIQGVVGVSNQPLNLVDLFWQIWAKSLNGAEHFYLEPTESRGHIFSCV